MPLARSVLALLLALLVALGLVAGLGPAVAAAAGPSPTPRGRWIGVDLAVYTATAYVDDRPVHVAPISAGKPGFETPTGTFQVFWRVASQTMDSATLGIPRDSREGYYLTNVRYVQYFRAGGYALHANYWMPDWVFGRAHTSHGCVGMRLADAEFFWRFAAEGTPVVIYRSSRTAVPAVVGRPLAAARAALSAVGLQAQVVEEPSTTAPRGVVVAQRPAAGASIAPGSAVSLTVSRGWPRPVLGPVRPPEGDWAWVPEVVGVPEAEARARVDQAGLANTYANHQVEADVAEAARALFRSVEPGSVLSAAPRPGERVPRGSVVRLAVRQP